MYCRLQSPYRDISRHDDLKLKSLPARITKPLREDRIFLLVSNHHAKVTGPDSLATRRLSLEDYNGPAVLGQVSEDIQTRI